MHWTPAYIMHGMTNKWDSCIFCVVAKLLLYVVRNSLRKRFETSACYRRESAVRAASAAICVRCASQSRLKPIQSLKVSLPTNRNSCPSVRVAPITIDFLLDFCDQRVVAFGFEQVFVAPL